jgi:hypothetical protein
MNGFDHPTDVRASPPPAWLPGISLWHGVPGVPFSRSDHGRGIALCLALGAMSWLPHAIAQNVTPPVENKSPATANAEAASPAANVPPGGSGAAVSSGRSVKPGAARPAAGSATHSTRKAGDASKGSDAGVSPEQSDLERRLWRRREFGEFYATRVVGSARLTVDGVAVSPLLGASEVPVGPDDVRFNAYLQQRPAPADFSARHDDAPGGLGQWLSPRGTDHWHGQFYGIPRLYFLQPSTSDAAGAIRYRSNRYGGSAGGRIGKHPEYVFADFLGTHQESVRQLQGYVPDSGLRSRIAAVEPELTPILDGFPQGGTASSPGILAFSRAGTQNGDQKLALVRFDRTADSNPARVSRSAWFARFNMAFVQNQSPLGGTDGYLRDTSVQRSQPFSFLFAWTPSAGTRQVIDVRFAYLRGMLESRNEGPLQLPYSIAIPGLTTLNGNREMFADSNTYGAQASVTRTHGKHELAAGGEVRHVRVDMHLSDFGRIYFASLKGFSRNQVSTATYNQAVPPNSLAQWQDSIWVQARWQLRPNLRVAAGLRYELYSTLHETAGKAIPFDFSTCGDFGFCAPGSSFNQFTAASLDPRMSAAWSPAFGPKWVRSNMVLRAGAAIYHANGLLMDQTQPVYNEVKVFALTSSPAHPLRYPIGPYMDTNSSGIASARGMSRQRHNPYAAEWSLSLQTQISRDLSATGTYFGAEGIHLPTSTYLNLIAPSSGQRPHPSFGQIAYLDNTSWSNLQVFAVTALRTLRGGGQIMGGYNWAHEIDDGASGDIGAVIPQNPDCPGCERASGDLDIRHLGGVRAYNPIPLPVVAAGRLGARWINRMAERWSLLNDFYGTSGLPINVTIDRSAAQVATGYTLRQRPDLVPGVSLRPPTGRSMAQWINAAAFTTVHGLYGTAPRNVARGPAHWTMNSALQKDLLLPRGIHAIVMISVQNVLNHGNYAQPLADWSTPQFGRIVNPYSPAPGGEAGPRAMFFDISFSR